MSDRARLDLLGLSDHEGGRTAIQRLFTSGAMMGTTVLQRLALTSSIMTTLHSLRSSVITRQVKHNTVLRYHSNDRSSLVLLCSSETNPVDLHGCRTFFDDPRLGLLMYRDISAAFSRFRCPIMAVDSSQISDARKVLKMRVLVA